MNYEKKYKEALEKAKNCLKDGTITNTAISYIGTIFPELIESEDERVRKELLSFFTERAKYTEDSTFNGLSSKEIISWLEKQGEHAKFRDSIQVGDKLTLNEDGVLVNLTQLNRVVNKGIEKAINEKQGKQKSQGKSALKVITNKVEPFDKYEGFTDFERTLADICIGWIGEEPGWKQYIKDNADVLLKIAIKKSNSVQDAAFKQKPAWSEEDEEMLNSFLHKLEVCDLLSNKEGIWIKKKLKALKQNTWKPSDEQMKALNSINVIGSISYPGQGQELINLYQDLKKLRGE